MRIQLFFLLIIICSFTACSPGKKFAKSAEAVLLSNPELKTAHIGISIYDPSTGKYVYDYQGDHYFVPASNTKLLMCYAAMKYLGDSLEGWEMRETKDTLYLYPKGDPTFLHADFPQQNFFNLLKSSRKNLQFVFNRLNGQDKFAPLGNGWAWNDYQEDYMAQRSRFNIYGNVVTFQTIGDTALITAPFVMHRPYMDEPMMQLLGSGKNFRISRDKDKNKFWIYSANQIFKRQQIPFIVDMLDTLQLRFLLDTLSMPGEDWREHYFFDKTDMKVVHTQPTDSLLKITMHRSDNFFAEQTLLMVSEKILGLMNDAKIIDTLLKTDYKDMPQKPKWVDGSGLSRYNLITPRDFVFLLNKMKNEFDWNRITTILPTGGTGTFSNFYKNYAGRFYGKTGTLSNQVAMSGYIKSKSGKWLICSVLVNNAMTSAVNVRKAVEQFVTGVAERY